MQMSFNLDVGNNCFVGYESSLLWWTYKIMIFKYYLCQI